MRDDSKIIGKVKAQITRFSKRVSVGFPMPTRRFIKEMIYGIQAGKDVKRLKGDETEGGRETEGGQTEGGR